MIINLITYFYKNTTAWWHVVFCGAILAVAESTVNILMADFYEGMGIEGLSIPQKEMVIFSVITILFAVVVITFLISSLKDNESKVAYLFTALIGLATITMTPLFASSIIILLGSFVGIVQAKRWF